MHLLTTPHPTEHTSSHRGHRSQPTAWVGTASAPKAQQETCAHTGAHQAATHKAVISSAGQIAMAPALTVPPASVGSAQIPHIWVSLSVTCPTAYFWKKQGFRISTAGDSAVSLQFLLKRDGQTSTHQQKSPQGEQIPLVSFSLPTATGILQKWHLRSSGQWLQKLLH